MSPSTFLACETMLPIRRSLRAAGSCTGVGNITVILQDKISVFNLREVHWHNEAFFSIPFKNAFFFETQWFVPLTKTNVDSLKIILTLRLAMPPSQWMHGWSWRFDKVKKFFHQMHVKFAHTWLSKTIPNILTINLHQTIKLKQSACSDKTIICTFLSQLYCTDIPNT